MAGPATIRMIVGLGNPGGEHEKTRHNIGFWFVDALAHGESVQLKPEKKFSGDFTQLPPVPGETTKPVLLLKPMTYMNHSGNSVRALAQFYKIEPKEILVAHDELDLPVGTTRIKFGGGHAGHNGLRDIISQLRSKDFYRLRFGIGHPGDKDRVHDYVLSCPSKSDRSAFDRAISDAVHVLPQLLQGDVDAATRYLHV